MYYNNICYILQLEYRQQNEKILLCKLLQYTIANKFIFIYVYIYSLKINLCVYIIIYDAKSIVKYCYFILKMYSKNAWIFRESIVNS